jgi:glutamate synthase (ferredoxin)
MVDLEALEDPEDIQTVREMIRKHSEYTRSTLARKVLANWDRMLSKFVKVMPRDYKRAISAMKRAQAEGIPWEAAVMEGAHG